MDTHKLAGYTKVRHAEPPRIEPHGFMPIRLKSLKDPQWITLARNDGVLIPNI